MSAPILTVGEAAEMLAALDADADAAYLARQIRTFVQRGWLSPAGHRGRGRTAAALLDRRGLAFARMLTTLARFGLSPELMAGAAAALENVADLPIRQEVEPVDWLLDEVAKGRLWYFELWLLGGAESGAVSGGFVRAPEMAPFERAAFGSIVLPVNALLTALLREAAASGGDR